MSTDSISAYMQVFSNKRAVFECLKEFRKHNPDSPITLVSDGGESFREFEEPFDLRYRYSENNILPKGQLCGISGVEEYLSRVLEHCNSVDTDWVVILEEDVRTRRPIQWFPKTECAGARMNPYQYPLMVELTKTHGAGQYGFGMCGGSIFRRETFIDCMNRNSDMTPYVGLDPRIPNWTDIPLTLLFHMNGYSYSVWNEISESQHPNSGMRFDGDTAFDHADKHWYGIEWNPILLEGIRNGA